MKLKVQETPAGAAAPTAGGAIMADRFKLDAPDPNAKKAAGAITGPFAVSALLAAILALACIGIVTWLMYTNWDQIRYL